MSQPNSVILYRSRTEQEIDNLIWNGSGDSHTIEVWMEISQSSDESMDSRFDLSSSRLWFR